MSGGPSATTNTKQTESVGAWQPSQDALKAVLSQAGGLLGNTGMSGAESNAVGGLLGNSQTAGGYGSQIQGVTDKLFAGGGFGAGTPGVQQSWQTAQGALSPIAGMSLDPMTNPQTAQIMQQITDQATNAVGSQFAGAGRSFSGAHAGATGKAITEGLAPTLFNQYNANRDAAMGASSALMSGAQGTSGALDQSAGLQLGAQQAAPGSLSNLNQPQLMALQAEAARRGIPIQNLQDINSLILPIANSGREGTKTGTETQEVETDPWQLAAGGILGLGGLATAGGSGGILGSWFPSIYNKK